MDAAVNAGVLVVGWALLIASWAMEGKPGEILNLTAIALFLFSAGWSLVAMIRMGGE